LWATHSDCRNACTNSGLGFGFPFLLTGLNVTVQLLREDDSTVYHRPRCPLCKETLSGDPDDYAVNYALLPDNSVDPNVAGAEEAMLCLTIKTLNGRRRTLQTAPNKRVAQLKRDIYDCFAQDPAYEPEYQRLIFKNKILDNGDTVSSSGLSDNSLLHVVQRSHGGAGASRTRL
jgi:Ubiquitin family